MSENIAEANEPPDSATETQHRNLALLVYVLQGFGFVTGGLTWLAALLVNYLKNVRGAWNLAGEPLPLAAQHLLVWVAVVVCRGIILAGVAGLVSWGHSDRLASLPHYQRAAVLK